LSVPGADGRQVEYFDAKVRGLGAIQAALEAEGIEFILGVAPGVRLHPKNRRGK
jgi:hypothetical protein